MGKESVKTIDEILGEDCDNSATIYGGERCQFCDRVKQQLSQHDPGLRELKFRVADTRRDEVRFYYLPLQEVAGLDDTWFGEGFVWQQYANLKDKDGKEIYEGDIFKGRYGIDRVRFLDGGFWPFCGGINCPWAEDSLVIGNMYENPDMWENRYEIEKRMREEE